MAGISIDGTGISVLQKGPFPRFPPTDFNTRATVRGAASNSLARRAF